MSGELGVVKTYADLHAIVRQRVADLNVSHASVDHVAGLNDGYFGKLMARMKHLGPQTMPLVLCALGIKLVAVVDVEAQEAYTKRMPTRETAGNKMPAIESRKNKRRYANRDFALGAAVASCPAARDVSDAAAALGASCCENALAGEMSGQPGN